MNSDTRARPLLERDAEPDPLAQFARWFADAQAAGLRAPEAMAVATASPAGEPSVRMVLLKAFDERGFVFHTSYAGRKARELDANPRAALLFHWDTLGRQVRIEGVAHRVDPLESDDYFASRPRGGRLAAWASRQSERVPGREELEAAFADASARFAGDVPRPPQWGGYRVAAESYEFWQHRENRLHDRLLYTRAGAAWTLTRLAP